MDLKFSHWGKRCLSFWLLIQSSSFSFFFLSTIKTFSIVHFSACWVPRNLWTLYYYDSALCVITRNTLHLKTFVFKHVAFLLPTPPNLSTFISDCFLRRSSFSSRILSNRRITYLGGTCWLTWISSEGTGTSFSVSQSI